MHGVDGKISCIKRLFCFLCCFAAVLLPSNVHSASEGRRHLEVSVSVDWSLNTNN